MLAHKPDYYQDGSEQGDSSNPVAYLTSTSVSGSLSTAVGFSPRFTSKVSNAIQIDYIAKPSIMSAAGDIPRLPVDTILVEGGTGWALRQKGEMVKAREWLADYKESKLTAVSRYTPTSMGYPQRTKVPRIYQSMFNRNV